jgi:hypothetical protein
MENPHLHPVRTKVLRLGANGLRGRFILIPAGVSDGDLLAVSDSLVKPAVAP